MNYSLESSTIVSNTSDDISNGSDVPDHICLNMGEQGSHLHTSYYIFIYASSLFVISGLIGNALSVMVSARARSGKIQFLMSAKMMRNITKFVI